MEPKEKCLLVWDYMAKHSVSKVKAYFDLDLESDSHYCPACELVGQGALVDNRKCINCPMYGKWWGEEGSPYAFCFVKGTYYSEWEDTYPEESNYKALTVLVRDNIAAEWIDEP